MALLPQNKVTSWAYIVKIFCFALYIIYEKRIHVFYYFLFTFEKLKYNYFLSFNCSPAIPFVLSKLLASSSLIIIVKYIYS